ncbi:MAG: response regulator [Lachnospiraceae bacterium]|nr:response regulator [Lachnospiraceae bacterium]
MDKQLVWKDEFNIGVEAIDKEHQRLFSIINRLFTLRKEEQKSGKACEEGIRFFYEHAIRHFTDEENYMELIGYKNLKMHKRIHKDFRDRTLPVLEGELKRTNYSPEAVDHFLAVCAGWLIGHTTTEDLAIVSGDKNRWEELLPVQELESMKTVITDCLKHMFDLKARVISETYDGEKFGNGIYYRVVYGREQDRKKWEIIMVFEEKILINTIGKLMGVRSEKLDVMLINAVRYSASQFVWHVMSHFPSVETYEMEEENLLTYEEFRQIFDKEKPQVSLLFGTDQGYFSYCIIAPHLLETGIGTPLAVQNEMAETRKYFNIRKQKENTKPKILLVDDSMTIREGIRRLLIGDYEVSAVQSGVSAIRAITLDKPDLVLLDYDMPVCDGRHVLEMLRSEKEFADVSVIFLTSRDDPESVKKVLSLKPEGYMMKYLKPTEIRKRVDNFFRQKKAEQAGRS